MTSKERLVAVFRGERPDRVPFVPAVYEHKARLIGATPSAVCRDPRLLRAALLAELETYRPDALTVGIDVYNVEAEAAGCTVHYFASEPHVPAIAGPCPGAPRLPDPERDGRMPLFLDAAAQLVRELGGELVIRGALSGPYSIAAELAGAERFVMMTVEEPEEALRLLRFAARIAAAFGKAFLARGAQVVLFDSRATPRLASPRVFRELVLPVYRDFLIPELKAAGAWHIPLIIGGNTNAILDDLIATGATQLLCDAPCDRRLFRDRCVAAGVAFRASVDARLVHHGPPAAIRSEAAAILHDCGDAPGFLLGCGVVAYDTPPEHVRAIRAAL